MDIYMKSISFSATKNDVYHQIASVLHGPDYQQHSALPLNFHVMLFPDRRGAGHIHGGSGLLTLPSVDIGERFLSEYAGRPPLKTISVRTRRILFDKSTRRIDQQVVQRIRDSPYVEPEVREAQQSRRAQLHGQAVSIRALQFGWECRDAVFSVEWERYCVDNCTLHFEQDRREIRVKLEEVSRTLVVVIRFATIQWSAKSNEDDPALFFSLIAPPIFESELPLSEQEELLAAQHYLFQGTIYDIAPRLRLSSLDEEHLHVVPYVSLALRLVCSSTAELSKFQALAKVARLAQPGDFPYVIARRCLFSHQLLRQYTDWVERLNWKVAFQVEALMRGLSLDTTEILSLRACIESAMQQNGEDHTSRFLRYFGVQVKDSLSPFLGSGEAKETVEECFQRSLKEFLEQERSGRPKAPISNDTFQCLHIKVTPTTMYLEGPFPEVSNRVMRWYPRHHDYFVRVTFVEESLLQFRWDREVDGREFVTRRVGGLLKGGLPVAARLMKFLAYSQSALKEHAVWFMLPFSDVTPEAIVRRIGTFDAELMRCPSRYGARISQAFTATDGSITVEAEEIILNYPDIIRHGHCFTDGIGTMSRELCKEIWDELVRRRRRARRGRRNADDCPRAYQIRLMGSKGMIMVDSRLSGRVVCLTPSMIKFQAPESREIEIARAFDRPTKYVLNRPLIMILEDLGVPYETFERLQDEAVEEAHSSKDSLARAARLLESHGLGGAFRLTSVMLSLEKLDLPPPDDTFYDKLMEFAVNHVLRELKYHARIPVNDPGSWTLVGVADIHGFLQEDEVFACVRVPGQQKQYLKGRVLISRSPCIHPGDARVVTAIGSPPSGSPFATEPLPNTVVFSTKGSRPLPSCLGGGDLDGDIYNVTTREDLRPLKQTPPGSYDAAPKKLLDRPSTLDDVADFVAEYINSDVVGIIAINWLIIADQSKDGIFDSDCMLLAQLHSDAVDYPKSGQPVPLKKIPKLKFRDKPDWNAPETVGASTEGYYDSQRAIGKLFRRIEMPAVHTVRRAARAQQRRQLHQEDEDLHELFARLDVAGTADGNEDEDSAMTQALEEHVSQYISLDLDRTAVESALALFRRYATELYTICAANSLSQSRSAVLTEEEAVVGTIVAQTSQPRMRRDLMSKLREQTAFLVTDIREELGGQNDMLEERLEHAWIAWKVSNALDSFGSRSFGWIALGLIFEITKAIDEEDRFS
ncbi:RdRP-domain-containing protein [Heliocybe sulcata]|uniref:RNA-dependent RNA polymerase n=1 Tax=Heliocybe sulcata TaxID=5364 RepID=A0A5C3NHG6_9AGAM|nr:RdRP-domain-containing protein [Heliocybe sulcata]